MRWELEEYCGFPVFEILIIIAIYSILTMPPLEFLSTETYANLHWGIHNVFLFLIFGVSAVFSRSFAGSFAKGETKLLLAYPIKRWQLFLSKFVTLFLVFFAVYCIGFYAQVYLLSLSILEPMLYVSLIALFLQLLLFCSVVVVLSLIVKNEIISILVSILLLYGLESIAGASSYGSSAGRFKIIFAYFGVMTHGELPPGFMFVPTTENVVMAITIPFVVSVILIVLCLIYFIRIMEID